MGDATEYILAVLTASTLFRIEYQLVRDKRMYVLDMLLVLWRYAGTLEQPERVHLEAALRLVHVDRLLHSLAERYTRCQKT